MSHFRATQYRIITDIVNRVTQSILQARVTDTNASHPKELTWDMGHQIMESLVDELCIEFTRDNKLFNEDLFRYQCGNLISDAHAVVENKQEDNKSC